MQQIPRLDATGLFVLISLWLVLIPSSPAAPALESIQRVGQRWDEIAYHWPKPQQAHGLKVLLRDIQHLKNQLPGRAEPLIWEAIVLVTQASLDPGLSALNMVEKAKDLLLRAVKIDPSAMHGAAYLTLACLYYKVPGWPLSFGNPQKAEQYFQKALTLNPDGIESHYYYGHYLDKFGRTQEAFAQFQQVTQLPPDPSQPYLSLRLKRKARAKLDKLVVQAKL